MLPVSGRVAIAMFLGFALAGCGQETVGPAPESVDPPALSITPRPRAFFFVNRARLEGPDWPDHYRSYGLFVCDPVLTAAEIASLRSDFPGVTLLTYANAQAVRIGMHGEAYWQALTAAFDSTLCIRDLSTGSVVRFEGVPAFVHGPQTSEALAAFHRDVTMQLGTDGIFVDQVTASYPEWKRVHLGLLPQGFDMNGDGAIDDLAALDAAYATWKPCFLQRLRDEIGDTAILVGNSNGPLSHPAFNGISLENVAVRCTVAQARAWVLGQVFVAHIPRRNVLWAFQGLSWEPSEELARQLPGTHVGDLFPRSVDLHVEPAEWDDSFP